MVNYLERHRQRKIERIRRERSEEVGKIELVARNTDMEYAEVEQHILELESCFAKCERLILQNPLILPYGYIFGGIGFMIASTIALGKNNYPESMFASAVLVSSPLVYLGSRAFIENRRRKQYEASREDAIRNNPSIERLV